MSTDVPESSARPAIESAATRSLRTRGHPTLRQVLSWIESVTVENPETVVMVMKAAASNRLPPTVASMPILSRAYYETHDFQRSSLEVPLSSGAYRVGPYETGRFVEYHRVEDWWGRDLPVSRGQANFDVLRVEFFRDRQIAFQALTKGALNFREEFTSKTWATEYNFPAVEDGRVVKAEFPDNLPAGAQGWFINLRREKFADPRTRRALDLAFDFQWTNTNLFYGAYARTSSYFENSEMKAEGMPSEAELALLEPLRDKVPDAVFGEAWTPPVSSGSCTDLALLQHATDRGLHVGEPEPELMLAAEHARPLDPDHAGREADSLARRAPLNAVRGAQLVLGLGVDLGPHAAAREIDERAAHGREGAGGEALEGPTLGLSASENG